MRQAQCLHSLAKTRSGPAFSNAAKERSGDDSPKKRERDGLWNHWLQRKERSTLSRFSQIVETVRRQAGHRDRLDAYWRVAALSWWPGEGAFAEEMHMQMGHTFACIGAAVNDDTIAAR